MVCYIQDRPTDTLLGADDVQLTTSLKAREAKMIETSVTKPIILPVKGTDVCCAFPRKGDGEGLNGEAALEVEFNGSGVVSKRPPTGWQSF